LNFLAKGQGRSQEILDVIEPKVFEITQKCNGSVSAEHGIGRSKVKYLNFSKSESTIQVMRNIKNLFDPNGIMNPYKVVPDKV